MMMLVYRTLRNMTGLEIMVPDTQMDVRFPKLCTLSYNNIRSEFVFMPKIISVHLTVSWNAFCDFSKLPITTIDMLQVVFTTFVPGMDQTRYRAANRLSNAIENPGNTHLSFNESSRISSEKVYWKNVNPSNLLTTDICELVCMVCNMQQIEMLFVTGLKYTGLYENLMSRLQINESRLKQLSAWKFLLDRNPEFD